MVKTKKVINSDEYIIEVEGKIARERYWFTIWVYSKKNKLAPYQGWLSEEFIEDDIDNLKRISYLGKVTLKVAENHLDDFLKLEPHRTIGNIKYWFKEAKRQVDLEDKNEKIS